METPQPLRNESLPELTDGADLYFGHLNDRKGEITPPWLLAWERTKGELAPKPEVHEPTRTERIIDFTTRTVDMRRQKVEEQDQPGADLAAAA